tara:strand:- start:1505 stop:1762 length:258 start_codon:yes stop_codon:yes gene_type:complete
MLSEAMEKIIEEKNTEIKRLHQVYDIENVIKVIDILNDENDKMYDKLMMITLQYKQLVKKYDDVLQKKKKYKYLLDEALTVIDDI